MRASTRLYKSNSNKNQNRETVIADCRAVMEALADCGPIDVEMEAVSDEMEVTAGLI